jgi:hypothetical protein
VNMAQSFPRLLSVAKRFRPHNIYKNGRLFAFATALKVCSIFIRVFENTEIRITIAVPHGDETVGLISDLATLIK